MINDEIAQRLKRCAGVTSSGLAFVDVGAAGEHLDASLRDVRVGHGSASDIEIGVRSQQLRQPAFRASRRNGADSGIRIRAQTYQHRRCGVRVAG